MGRIRYDGGSKSKLSSEGQAKGKSLEDRITQPHKSDRKKGGGNPKDKPKFVPNPEHKDAQCWHCGVMGHKSPDCPDKDKPKTYVGETTASKNDHVPTPPSRKRNRKDK